MPAMGVEATWLSPLKRLLRRAGRGGSYNEQVVAAYNKQVVCSGRW